MGSSLAKKVTDGVYSRWARTNDRPCLIMNEDNYKYSHFSRNLAPIMQFHHSELETYENGKSE